MEHYVDIQIRPDPEFKEALLMNALFSKLHRAFVTIGNQAVGISFPDFNKNLGNILRLHGNMNDLIKIMEQECLVKMRDFVIFSKIREVPIHAKYRTVYRVHADNSKERLRRRSIKKGWITESEAVQKIPDKLVRHINLPFIQLSSQSTGQSFKLFIEQGAIAEEPVAGTFNKYGLSKTATVPWF